MTVASMYNNPYAAKLTFQFRCFIYAAHHYKRASYETLARAFDVNAETVGKICRSNKRSRNYRNVHAEADRMGLERMWDTYCDADTWRQIENMQHVNVINLRRELHVANGPGVYWLEDKDGVKHRVDIRHTDWIRENYPDAELYDSKGFLVHCSDGTWSYYDKEPWRSVEDALRYFEAWPNSLEGVN